MGLGVVDYLPTLGQRSYERVASPRCSDYYLLSIFQTVLIVGPNVFSCLPLQSHEWSDVAAYSPRVLILNSTKGSNERNLSRRSRFLRLSSHGGITAFHVSEPNARSSHAPALKPSAYWKLSSAPWATRNRAVSK